MCWEGVSQLASKRHPHTVQAETLFSVNGRGQGCTRTRLKAARGPCPSGQDECLLFRGPGFGFGAISGHPARRLTGTVASQQHGVVAKSVLQMDTGSEG